MKPVARAFVLPAFAVLASGCAILPGARKSVVPETEWNSVPSAARPYLERMFHRIDARWNREIASLREYPPAGARVAIRFHLNSAGLITRIDDVDENAGKAATYACLNAITVSQPYPKWSEEMIAAVGDEQQVTLIFSYDEPERGRLATNRLPAGASGG